MQKKEKKKRRRKRKKDGGERGQENCAFTGRFPYRIQRVSRKFETLTIVLFLQSPLMLDQIMLNRCSVLGFLAFISSACTFIKQIGAIKLVKLIYVFSSIEAGYVANFLRKTDKGIYRETSYKSKRDIFGNILSSMNFNIYKEIYYKYVNFFLLF